MIVAVTGATGHLGGWIIRELYKQGHEIKALIRGDAPNSFEDITIEWIIGDLGNPSALMQLMNSCDACIHSAALISIHGDQGGAVHQTNVTGTRNVMEAALACGVKRFIHVSTIHTYQSYPYDVTLDESRSKISGKSFAYDLSKKEGEDIAFSYASENMDVLAVHPTSIIGPRDFKPSKMGKAIIDMCTGKLPFVFKGGYDFCDARDVAAAICNALQMGRSGESYLLSGKWYSIKEIADFLQQVSGKKINPIPLPMTVGWIGLPFIYAYGWFKKEPPLYTNEALVAISRGNRKISSAKAQKELNYNIRPIEETLKDTYEWFLKNGYLA